MTVNQNQSKESWCNLGISLSKEKKFKLALGAYKRALDIDDQDEVTWSNMGKSLTEQGKIVL